MTTTKPKKLGGPPCKGPKWKQQTPPQREYWTTTGRFPPTPPPPVAPPLFTAQFKRMGWPGAPARCRCARAAAPAAPWCPPWRPGPAPPPGRSPTRRPRGRSRVRLAPWTAWVGRGVPYLYKENRKNAWKQRDTSLLSLTTK